MKEDKYLSEVSKKRMNRVMARICLIIIAVLIITTLITGIMGSPYFLGCLMLCIIVPILIYAALWIGRVLYSMNPNRDSSALNIQDEEKKGTSGLEE